MVLPIYVYGMPILRKIAENINQDYTNIDKLIADMYETMYATEGVGLAAPQIGKSIRLIVIDASPFKDDNPELDGFKMTIINPKIITLSGKEESFNEGCLSIPSIREDILRPSSVTITYQNEHFETKTETYEGIIGRIIQHEYDHLEGKLFIDKASALRRQLLKRKLTDISKGNTTIKYKIVFPVKR